MTWAQALAHLGGLAPSNIKMGLGRVQAALDLLGNPERRFPAVQVAGTNGKGSTCAIMAACLQTQYRTGLYTSPHLIRPNERIQIDGVEIDDPTFGRRIAQVLAVLGLDHQLTYFELGTVVAFWHFAQEKVDLAVLETGLGGRLDATTACIPLVTGLTPIDFDHQEFLGHTLAAIAQEKAAITKPQVPLVSSAQHPEVLAVIERAAQGPVRVEGRDFGTQTQPDGGVTYWSGLQRLSDLQLRLKGPHQLQNLAVALACLEELGQFPLTGQQLHQGVLNARWPGRVEHFALEPPVVLDGAHNPAGAKALVRALDTEFGARPIHLIFGVFEDKDSAPMMRALFPRVQALHLTPVASPRSKDPASYQALAQSLNRQVLVHADAPAALAAARAMAPRDGVIVVAGSLFLVGQLRRSLLDLVDSGGSTVNLLKP